MEIWWRFRGEDGNVCVPPQIHQIAPIPNKIKWIPKIVVIFFLSTHNRRMEKILQASQVQEVHDKYHKSLRACLDGETFSIQKVKNMFWWIGVHFPLTGWRLGPPPLPLFLELGFRHPSKWVGEWVLVSLLAFKKVKMTFSTPIGWGNGF